MKPLIKTDQCIELLADVLYTACDPKLFQVRCDKEFIPILEDAVNIGETARKRYAELGITSFETDEDALKYLFDKDDIFRRLTRAKAMLCYVACPSVIINATFTDREEMLSFLKANNLWTGEPFFDTVFDIIQLGQITANDLKNELWEACPDPKSMREYLKIVRVKFEKISVKLPNRDTYSYDNLLLNANNNPYSTYIWQLNDIGLITVDEAKELLILLYHVISGLHDNVSRIVRTYNELYKITNSLSQDLSGNDTSNSKKSQFSIPEWCVIFYYTIAAKHKPQNGTIKDKILKFMEKHQIGSKSYNYFRTEYYKIRGILYNEKKQSIDILKSAIKHLRKITPFVEQNYPESVSPIESDIKLFEDELVDIEDCR